MNVEWLVGKACTRVCAHTAHSTTFEFEDAKLVVEALWRITVDSTLRRTSLDHGQQFGLPRPVDAHADAFALLRGRRVTQLGLDEQQGDLTIQLGDNTVLEVITDSSGYEPWMLTAPGRHIAAGSGGTVHDLTAEV